MGEPVKLEGRELAEVIERAARTVEAIGLAEPNPTGAPFFARIAACLDGSGDVGTILGDLREAVSTLVAELDVTAIALVTVNSRIHALSARVVQLEDELADQLALNTAIASAGQETNHV